MNFQQEAYNRIESIKESHRRGIADSHEQVETTGPDGITTQSFDAMLADQRNQNIVEVCEMLEDVLPGPEPDVVVEFRSLLMAIALMRGRFNREAGSAVDPLLDMRNRAIQLRDEATQVIEDRMVLETPNDEEDADVLYIHDPVTRVRHTTALGGYKKDYDEARIAGLKRDIAEQILYEPVPADVPLV